MKKLFLMILMLCLISVLACAEDQAFLRVENGMMQPVLKVGDARAEDYTNEDSEVLRFCVWVETDYDTDFDGMADLVKVFVQVPRAAAQGTYKAAAIYDPTPYNAGTVANTMVESGAMYNRDEPFDYESLYHACEKRNPQGSVSTLEAASQADPLQWIYTVPISGAEGFPYFSVYDYYLARGFAVVEASGIGTYGSEGFELCGMKPERDGHKAVVEWLTGDRRAFTDTISDVEVRAEWCNGNVAMTGISYGGTLPFSVAVTGVKGLKTIIPCAGIASWYDYTNAQGVPTLNDANYADYLAASNAGGTFLDELWEKPNPKYGAWLSQIAADQEETNGDYAPVWEMLDYTTKAENHLACSALIVTGLNDYNVTTIHAARMMQCFREAGQMAKMVLHQDGHNTLAGVSVNGRPFEEMMNAWLSHYLYGVENQVESMPEVLAQSNVDGTFVPYDSWQPSRWLSLRPEGASGKTEVFSHGMADYVAGFADSWQTNLTQEMAETLYTSMPEEICATYTLSVPANTTIKGVPEVHVKLDSTREDLDGLMITAVLLDVCDRGTFEAYQTENAQEDTVPFRYTEISYDNGREEIVPLKELTRKNMPVKCVSMGWTDLQNPGMGFDAQSYVLQEEGLQSGVEQDYTFYLMPNVYTVAEGHHLELRLFTWDPIRVYLDDDFEIDVSMPTGYLDKRYDMIINNESLEVRLPLS